MNNLQQQILELTKKHNFNEFAKSIANGVEYTAILSKRNFISFKCKNLQEAQYLLTNLKPSNDISFVGTANDDFFKIINSPYRLDIKNPIKPSNYDPFLLKITFSIENCDIWVNLPLDCFKHDFIKTSQKVNECNMHYFGGISRQQLGKMHFLAYTFNNNYVINFYGGQKTLFCDIETNNIINSILKQ